jgi:hypothetical protein
MKTFVEIHWPGAGAERHELTAERVSIGTGKEATIRVPISTGFESEQLELFAGERDVRVQIPPGIKGRLMFEGAEERRVRVPIGGEVFVGNVRLSFLGAAAHRRIPLLLLLAVLGFAIMAGFRAYEATRLDDPSSHEVPAPTLFDSGPAFRCPDTDRLASEHRARQDERTALAKHERAAFFPSDGPDAAALLGQAAACFERANKHDDAERMSKEASQWKQQINERYVSLRLRLRAALDNKRTDDALSAVKELKSLLAHQQDGPYRQWLEQVDRNLESKLARPRN